MKIIIGRDTVVDPQTVEWQKLDEQTFKKYRIRQEPGAFNALSHIKFMFPNRFDVYLHDTPRGACSSGRSGTSATAACGWKNQLTWRSIFCRMTGTGPGKESWPPSARERTWPWIFRHQSPCTSPTGPPGWILTERSNSGMTSTDTIPCSRRSWARKRPSSRHGTAAGRPPPRREGNADGKKE